MRDFLVYCPVGKDIAGDWLRGNREYDIALNFWKEPQNFGEEYHFEVRAHKWAGITANIPHMPVFNYKAIAIIDDDLEFNTESINKLFHFGTDRQFELWQPALTRDSVYSHDITLQCDGEYRLTGYVEVMAPFISHDCLCKIYWTFGLTESGWGVDKWIWPKLANIMAVVDCLPVRHVRELAMGKGIFHRSKVGSSMEGRLVKQYSHLLGPRKILI